jgi:NAD(P)-dependent dehydrogenase (short-subunit alcohol dehydrogenase family)
MTESYMLKDRRVLITGGGTGLGLSIARSFIEQGAKAVISGRRKDVLEKACRELGENCTYFQNDLSRLEEIPAFVESIETDAGPLDILVNNAGIHLKKDMLEVSDHEYESIILINQQAVFALTREVAKYMKKRQTGTIIMISSMSSQYGIPKVIAYTASKAAVEGMTRAMAVELSLFGIRVNCIAPGFIKTEMLAKALDGDTARKARVLDRTPLHRLGEPEDIANAAVFLASAAASYINGVILPVDGGNSIGF